MKIISTSISNQCFLGKWGDPIQKEIAQFKPVLSGYPQCNRAMEEVSLLADTIDVLNNTTLNECFITLNNNLISNLSRLKLLAAGREYEKAERENSKPFVHYGYYTAKIAEQEYEKECLDEISDITDKLTKLNAEIAKKK